MVGSKPWKGTPFEREITIVLLRTIHPKPQTQVASWEKFMRRTTTVDCLLHKQRRGMIQKLSESCPQIIMCCQKTIIYLPSSATAKMPRASETSTRSPTSPETRDRNTLGGGITSHIPTTSLSRTDSWKHLEKFGYCTA